MSRLACIMSQFPRYDEAFILRELVELSKGPSELLILSLRPCRDRVMHEQAKSLLSKTVYAPFLWSRYLWRSHGWFLRRRPRVYWGALGWILSRHARHPVILVKTLAFFPKTVHFAKVALEREVTHLHAGWATYPAACALLMSRLTDIPYSLAGHAHDLYTTNPTLAEKIRGARFVVTCTEENKRYLEQLLNGHAGRVLRPRPGTPAASFGEAKRAGVADGSAGCREAPGPLCVTRPAELPTPRIVVSYHGVDLSRFAAVPKSTSALCRLLAVGSLLPCKGYETLIDSCRLLAERAVPFHCTIAGGGPLEGALRRLIERHGLRGQVEITGYVTQERVASLYQHAHLFALPLRSQIHWGIPNVLIEALATKTPVICCGLPSMRELVEHGTSGWIIPENDPPALADAVTSLWRDPVLRVRLGEAGYRRVAERFALEVTGARLRAVFAEWVVG